MTALRPYQSEAKTAIREEWNKGNNKTLTVLPTGTGKTIVFSSLAGELAKEGETVLTLAHREELLAQAIQKQYSVTGILPSLEKADSSCLKYHSPLVVGSIQTISRVNRLERFPRDFFSTIIIDEAHHALSPSYLAVLEHFQDAKVLGVTATPDRADKKELGKVFNSLAYEYSMRDAIQQGYLVPIKAQTIPLKIDISSVHTSMGDFDANELQEALTPYLNEIADNMLKYCRGRKTVVFLPLIAISQQFTRILNSKGFKAVEVNGGSQNRSEIIQAFSDGKYNVICNAMLLTEGWDCPSVDCVIVLRPTQSRGLYQQMVGRGTRLSPETCKKDLLLLDFLWMTAKHNLCKPCSLVAKSKDIADKMTQIIELGDCVDLMEAEAQGERDVLAERENSLAEKLKENRCKKAQLVDPMQYIFSIEAEDLSNYEPQFMWEAMPASESQLKTLSKFGIDVNTVTCKGYASMLLNKLMKRSKENMATPKQIRCLERFGYEHVGMWKFETANKIISILAGVGWKLWKLPKEFTPKNFIAKEVIA